MSWRTMIHAVAADKLIANWQEQLPLKGTGNEKDYHPVVKLFNPIGTGTWLVTECDEDGLAFGLADIGYPEMGYFDLNEIAEIRLLGGAVRIEQDILFEADKPISEYASEARQTGHIIA